MSVPHALDREGRLLNNAIKNSWRANAPCRTAPENFFPERADLHEPPPKGAVDAAIKVCASCPFHLECYEAWVALPSHTARNFGVWFGTSAGERGRLGRAAIDARFTGADIPPRRAEVCVWCGTNPVSERRRWYCSAECKRQRDNASRPSRAVA